MQKTKVVVIHNVVSPHVTKLFQELSKLVDLQVLYCAKGEENRSWKGRASGFKYKILPNFSIKMWGKDLFTYFINPTITKELQSIKPKVVILAGWDLFSYQVAFLYCKLQGIKVILWSGSTRYEPSWRRTVSQPLVNLIIRGSDAYIAYGTRAKEYLVVNGAKKENIFIYNHTTDIKKYKRLSKYTYSNKEKVILYYGQLIERKGVDILIKAFALLQKEVKNLKLLIAGSGKFRSELIKLSQELNIVQKVNFIKDPGDDKMSKYFSQASFLVLPSREEVWGLVVNEAMACGLPAIVSNVVGSSKDLIQNGVNGYVFKSESTSDLKDKMKTLVTKNSLLKKMGKESLRIIKSYTPLNSAKIINKAIQSVEK